MTPATPEGQSSIDDIRSAAAELFLDLHAGYCPHLSIDLEGSAVSWQQAETLIADAAASQGVNLVRLTVAANGEHPLDQYAHQIKSRFLRVQPKDLPHTPTRPFLRFADACDCATRLLNRPMLLSVADAAALRRLPEQIDILSAIRAALIASQGRLRALFFVNDDMDCLLFGDERQPMYQLAVRRKLIEVIARQRRQITGLSADTA